MQGQVLEFETQKGGLILGDDGNRYQFPLAEWRGGSPPAAGMGVDFLASGDRARQVYPVARSQPLFAMPQASNSVMLGWIGIGCLLLGFVIPILPTIAAFILGMIGADSAKRSGDRAGLLLSRIAWVGALVILVIGLVLLSIGFTILGLLLHTVFSHVVVTGPGIVA
ncbi:MAG TPA: hypothetical protein VGO70_09805 [Arsenicitalea sp.]|nr:hypothetical protein [Arsenicitalea sp.]